MYTKNDPVLPTLLSIINRAFFFQWEEYQIQCFKIYPACTKFILTDRKPALRFNTLILSTLLYLSFLVLFKWTTASCQATFFLRFSPCYLLLDRCLYVLDAYFSSPDLCDFLTLDTDAFSHPAIG